MNQISEFELLIRKLIYYYDKNNNMMFYNIIHTQSYIDLLLENNVPDYIIRLLQQKFNYIINNNINVDEILYIYNSYIKELNKNLYMNIVIYNLFELYVDNKNVVNNTSLKFKLRNILIDSNISLNTIIKAIKYKEESKYEINLVHIVNKYNETAFTNDLINIFNHLK